MRIKGSYPVRAVIEAIPIYINDLLNKHGGLATDAHSCHERNSEK